jgi:ubiquinone/menaquinone biosynthesis C-methylase UbiE
MDMVANNRIEREKSFHNAVFDECSASSRRTVTRMGMGLVERPKEVAHRLIVERCRPSRILEFGCGPGWYTQRLARNFTEAEVMGIDISDVAVEQATRRARRLGLCNASFRAMDAEQLDFDDQAFDLVVGLGILHHLDLRKAVDEVERVLCPGGAAIFVEPLAHNFALKLFRRLTPGVRTVDEHPLTMQDLEIFKSRFTQVDHHFVNCTTLCAVPIPRFLGREAVIKALGTLDRSMFTLLPFSRRFAWSVVVVASKRPMQALRPMEQGTCVSD